MSAKSGRRSAVSRIDEAGRSVNVTDGVRRITPTDPGPAADGSVPVAIDLWPVGHRFAAGFTSGDDVPATVEALRRALADAPHLPA